MGITWLGRHLPLDHLFCFHSGRTFIVRRGLRKGQVLNMVLTTIELTLSMLLVLAVLQYLYMIIFINPARH